MDRTSRTIIVSLIVVLGVALLALATSLFVPFNVDQTGEISAVSGVVELRTPGDLPVTVDESAIANNIEFEVGQQLRIQPGGTAHVTFFNKGRAVLTGPAMLTLSESHRRATALGHILDSDQFERQYILTIEQTQGRVRYDFANTTPSFEELDLTVELPTTNYKPASPCWSIDIAADGSVTAAETDCPT